MPRLPRYELPGVPQYIIQLGNNRQAIFAADGDYLAYRGMTDSYDGIAEGASVV